MKPLKALITKNNIHRAHTLNDSNYIYCIANYDDDLDLIGNDVVTVKSKDRVTIHILNREAMNRHLKEIDEMLCDVWGVKDLRYTIEDVRKKIANSTWREDLDKRLCEQVYLYTIKEALISKKNIHKAHVPGPNDCLKSDLLPFDIVTFSSYGDMVTAMYLTPRELTDYIGLTLSGAKLFPNGVFLTKERDLVNVDFFDDYLKSRDSGYSHIKVVLRYDEKVFGTIRDEESMIMILQSPLVERLIKKYI